MKKMFSDRNVFLNLSIKLKCYLAKMLILTNYSSRLMLRYKPTTDIRCNFSCDVNQKLEQKKFRLTTIYNKAKITFTSGHFTQYFIR